MAPAVARLPDQHAGVVSADIEVARAVVRHSVAVIAGIARFGGSGGRAPAVADACGDVTEVEALLLAIPNGTFDEPKARAEFLDGSGFVHQFQQRG